MRIHYMAIKQITKVPEQQKFNKDLNTAPYHYHERVLFGTLMIQMMFTMTFRPNITLRLKRMALLTFYPFHFKIGDKKNKTNLYVTEKICKEQDGVKCTLLAYRITPIFNKLTHFIMDFFQTVKSNTMHSTCLQTRQ